MENGSGRSTKTTVGLWWILPIALALISGCPLPFEFSGSGVTGAQSRDPSSPDVTLPVSFSYQQSGGGGGAAANGATVQTTSDTTITLSTPTGSATIFYTTDGTPITSLSAAQSFSNSSGQVVLRINDPTPQAPSTSMAIRAVAVGPGMRPSPETAANFELTYDFPHRVIFSALDIGAVSHVPQMATNVLLYGVRLDVQGQTSTLSGFDFRFAGSLQPTDIRRADLWLSPSATFGGDAVRIQRRFSDAAYNAGDTVSFTASRTLEPGFHYLYVTTTIDHLAVPGRTVSVEPAALADISFSDGPELLADGPFPAGPTRTFLTGTNPFNLVTEKVQFSRRFTLSNIHINNSPTTSATVPVGQPVSLMFDFQSTQAGDFCPGCIVQAYVGVRGFDGACVTSFGGYSATSNGYQMAFTPPQAGTYFLTMGHDLEFSCQEDPEYRVTYFDGDQNFAVIVAQ
ncbi:MAG: hypothetical protein EA404_08755 [Spirochaetaceae bacterium]|nr:MAG: hypothetical protein EA404_08755 [Spirochaetaceae bacterium]